MGLQPGIDFGYRLFLCVFRKVSGCKAIPGKLSELFRRGIQTLGDGQVVISQCVAENERIICIQCAGNTSGFDFEKGMGRHLGYVLEFHVADWTDVETSSGLNGEIENAWIFDRVDSMLNFRDPKILDRFSDGARSREFSSVSFECFSGGFGCFRKEDVREN